MGLVIPIVALFLAFSLIIMVKFVPRGASGGPRPDSGAVESASDRATLGLALCDFAPILLYLGGSLFMAGLMRGLGDGGDAAMFLAGSLLVFLSGALKAVSKLGDALAARPVTESGFLYDQMFPVMSIGFLATAMAAILWTWRYAGTAAPGELARPWAMAAHIASAALLAAAVSLALSANRREPRFRPFFLAVKRRSMLAMIAFELATLGVLSWFAFRGGLAASGALLASSIVAMLAMGALGSPSFQAKFRSRLLMNWVDQAVNSLAQGCYLGAAWIARDRACARGLAGALSFLAK
jgi:hypothetical protein